MTAYKRSDRPESGYVISPTLPAPWHRVGPWQTGMSRKRDAERVEAWLKEMAITQPDVVDAIVEGDVKVMDAWVAHLRGTLDQLVAGVGDPLLTEAVESYRPLCEDDRARTGLDQLVEYTPDGMRLSALKGKAISEVYAKALRTRKPNTVQRSLHRAVRELLAHHLEPDAVRDAMRGVKVPSEDDTREVRLSAEEVRTLVRKTPNDRFGWMVALAILTTADRAPLLRLTPRDYRPGLLTIPDKKTRDRWRVIRLSAPAETVLRLAVAGLERDERLFPWTKWQVRKLWDATREAAGLDWLRFKDLRHLLPGALADLGVDRREIQAVLGHARGSKQTDRYVAPAGDVDRLDRAADVLGLKDVHLRKEA